MIRPISAAALLAALAVQPAQAQVTDADRAIAQVLKCAMPTAMFMVIGKENAEDPRIKALYLRTEALAPRLSKRAASLTDTVSPERLEEHTNGALQAAAERTDRIAEAPDKVAELLKEYGEEQEACLTWMETLPAA